MRMCGNCHKEIYFSYKYSTTCCGILYRVLTDYFDSHEEYRAVTFEGAINICSAANKMKPSEDWFVVPNKFRTQEFELGIKILGLDDIDIPSKCII